MSNWLSLSDWTITKCPEEEIGRNSDNPWTIPRSTADNKFISVKKIMGGAEGSTTIIKSIGSVKTLDDFKT